MTAKILPKDRLDAIKKVVSGAEKATKVCRELGVSRTVFYRWLKRYKKDKKFSSLIPKANLPQNWKNFEKLSPKNRLLMVERVKAGESVAKVCRLYKVSRPVFYKWLKRYDQAIDGEKLEALWDKKPQIERYYNQAPEQYEKAVLSAVCQYPELSSHKLVWVLPQIGGRPILGNHGVQNVLNRHDLATYEKRFAYSKEYYRPTLQSHFFGFFRSLLENVLSKSTTSRNAIVRGSFAFGSLLFISLVFFGLRQLGGLFQGGIIMSIGTIFSFISLTLGMFFFLYSLKYYITIAMVLSFSRKEKEGEEGEDKRSFLSKLFGISISVEDSSQKGMSAKQAALSVQSMGYQAGGGLQADLSKVILERKPFVSIHLATYNEKRVIDRLLTAATSQHYDNYEVVIVDDSNDETREILKKWESHPRVKVIKRETREGFKGAALKRALEETDKRAEFVIVFDADFIPYPDTIVQFLKYFQSVAGTLDFSKNLRVEAGNSKLDLEARGLKLDNQSSNFQSQNLASSIQHPASNIAAIQGYQWHVLNKSENWVTRGVRTEYAGSYVIERSATEIYGGLKQIAGSVYMIRRDVLKEIGWGTSITEDFQLTLKLYAKGYKVVYTPYIQAPAEAVSTVKRMIRQRMRWAEGHSHNIRKMFKELMFGKWADVGNFQFPISNFQSNPNSQIPNHKINGIWKMLNGKPKEGQVFIPSPLTSAEKVEVLYLTPYYLQALLFMAGTFFWFMAEAVFKVSLPFWTEVWGWSLVFTNLFALPLMNLVGLFLEESEEKDYVGLFSFIMLSYIVAPFQGYAAAKGFLAKEEGPWFRTPKTGRITDVFTPGRFYRKIFGWLGRPSGVHANNMRMGIPLINANYNRNISINSNFNSQDISINNSYLALATANNQFSNFKIRPKKVKRISRVILAVLLIISMNVSWLSFNVPLAQASPGTQIKTIEVPIYQFATETDDNDINASNGINDTAYATGHNVGQYTSQSIYNSTSYIAYYDVTMGDLKFIKCGNSTCSSSNTITTVDGAMVKDSGIEANVGKYASLQVISGTPYIAYYDATSLDLKFVKCGNDTCSSGNTISVVDSTGDVGQYASLQVVSGTPYISYYDLTNTNLKFVKCGNDSCSASNTISTISDSDAAVGTYTSLQVVSGTPYISYYGTTNTDLKFVKCGNDTCSSGNTISQVDNTEDDGQYPSLQVVSSIPYISYWDNTNYALKFVKCGDDTCDNTPANTISIVDSTPDAGGSNAQTSLQIVSGIPYISYTYPDSYPAWYLKFVKCGDDTCDNSPANTINSADSAMGSIFQYGSFQMLSGIPYISYYDGQNTSLKFVKCGDDTCDNDPVNTRSTVANGGFGVGFHLDIPETMADCLSAKGGTNPCYAFVEWRTIMSPATATAGEMKFQREEDTSGAVASSSASLNFGSGENQPLVMRQDVTQIIASGFNTYYFDAKINIARNTDSAKLYVTYEYDDTSTTQTKTVRYPLNTQAAQAAANECAPDVTINPNIQEGSVAIQRAWVEGVGQQYSGSTGDPGHSVFYQDGTCATGEGYAVGTTSNNNTQTDIDAKTTFDYVFMNEPTKVVASGASAGELNYNASNTISLLNAGQAVGLKGGELVITYNYSYYDQTNTTHRNSARYFIGQLSGALGTTYSTVGNPTVYLPESTPSNYSVYLKLVGTNTALANTRYQVTVASGTAVEYPTASTWYVGSVTEQSGRDVIFTDISSNFSTNCSSPSSGCTVKVEAKGDAANETYGIGAELILSYNFAMPTDGGTFTAIKTVNWFIGQQTAYTSNSYTGTFNTYIPESSTTFRSSAAIADYVDIAVNASIRMQVDVNSGSASVTDVDSGSTGEYPTYSALEQGDFTAASQTGLNFTVHTCSSTNCGLVPVSSLKGMTAWSTYEYTAPAVPEAVLIFLFLMPFLPKIVEWWKKRKNANMELAYANILANKNCANVCKYKKMHQRKNMNSPNIR